MRTLLVPSPLITGSLIVTGDEAHHGLRVLRLRPGDEVRLADGAGLSAVGRVLAVERDRLTVEVSALERLDSGPAFLLTVACAIPKGDRFGDLVRQLTELGIGVIRPLLCERGERLPGSLDRVRRIAAEALKQCRRGHLPVIGPAIDIPGLAASGSRLILLDRQGTFPDPGRPAPVTLVVGPEGGLSALETASLMAAQATMVRLAGSILRIETAALAAAAVWVAAWEGK